MVGVSLEAFILTPDLVEPLDDADLTISVGSIDSRDQLEPLLSLGRQIVVTDRPLEPRDEVLATVAAP